ncbi:MAG TPA: hypothetical protein VL147_01630 [Devosia sp.]|nr:hypothetical protein [Devosia sp.]
MILLRVCLSWARFYQCRWLEYRADRALLRCLLLQAMADNIRAGEREFLGLDPVPARYPSISGGNQP